MVIASGKRPNVILDLMAAEPVGTLFVESAAAGSGGDGSSSSSGGGRSGTNSPDSISPTSSGGHGNNGQSNPSAAAMADAARAGGRALQALSTEERAAVMFAVAAALRTRAPEILAANKVRVCMHVRARLHVQLIVLLFFCFGLGQPLVRALSCGCNIQSSLFSQFLC